MSGYVNVTVLNNKKKPFIDEKCHLSVNKYMEFGLISTMTRFMMGREKIEHKTDNFFFWTWMASDDLGGRLNS